MMKSILFVLTDITQCGGTERTVLSVANYLNKNNFKVMILSLNSSCEQRPFFNLSKNIMIRHLNVPSYVNKSFIYKIKGWIFSILKFRSEIKNINADVIISTSRNTNLLSLLFKHTSQTLIGCEHFAYNVPMNNFLRQIRDISYKKINRLIVLTRKDAEYYTNKGVKVDVIPNAIPFDDEITKSGLKKNMAIAIGRHTEQKAFDKLIKLWCKIENSIQDWQLLIIGEGPLLEMNKKLASDLESRTITFLPFTKNIVQYYQEASLYLMTSIYEAFPMVLIESKYFGCVNIAYDCDTGPSEIIKNREDGFVIPMDDEKQFINTISKLISNTELINHLSKKAELNSNDYLKSNILPQWIRLIDSFYHEKGSY